MATPNVGILTNAGKNLIDQVNAGQTKITFSKIVFSSMNNNQLTDDQIKALTTVAPQEIVVNNPEVTLDNNTGETRIRATGTNETLTDGVYVKTYAVYAKDDSGNEILYGITVSPNPNYLPEYDGVTPQVVTYSYKVNISNTSNITFSNSNDVYASETDLAEALQPYAKTVDVNQQFDKRVIDNKDGTEQLNGVQIQPFNKLTDTIGVRNYALNTGVPYVATGDGTSSKQFLIYSIGQDIPLTDNLRISFDLSVANPDGGTFQMEFDGNNNKNWGYICGYGNGVNLTSGHYSYHYGYVNNTNPINNGIYFYILNSKATVTISNLCVSLGDSIADWVPAPEDKADDSKVVHTSDMRKAPNDVAGIEEVNAKQDVIGYTPADDSKVAHLSGANNFDTVPTVNNNPLLLASSLPSDLARTGQDANFTGKLQKSGIDVATTNDVTNSANTKQDKLSYTPADDSKVVHNVVNLANGTDLDTLTLQSGCFMIPGAKNRPNSADDYTEYLVIPSPNNLNGVQVAYSTNNNVQSLRSWNFNTGKLTFTDWANSADDSKVVHTADMRKSPSDVAGIEEVNAKQDTIGYTPADDSKVIHQVGTDSMETQDGYTIALHRQLTDSDDLFNLPVNGIYEANGANPKNNPWGKAIWGVDIKENNSNIFLDNIGGLFVESNGTWRSMVNWTDMTNALVNKQDKLGYTPADDSKVAHLSGANNFDTTPTVNNNTVVTKDQLTNVITQQIDPNADLFAIKQAGVYKSAWGNQNTLKNFPSPDGSATIIYSGSDNTDNGIKITVIDSWGSVFVSTWQGAASTPGYSPWKNVTDVATTDDVTTAISTATANMADTTKPTNFTDGLQSGGVDVATAADLKSVEDSAWRVLDNNYITAFASDNTSIEIDAKSLFLFKIDEEDKRVYMFFMIFGGFATNSTLYIDLSNIVKNISFPNNPFQLLAQTDGGSIVASLVDNRICFITDNIGSHAFISEQASDQSGFSVCYVEYDELV